MNSIFDRLLPQPPIAEFTSFRIGESVVLALLHSLWIGALLAIALSCIVRLRRVPVELRYWASVSAIGLLLLLPALLAFASSPTETSPIAKSPELTLVSQTNEALQVSQQLAEPTANRLLDTAPHEPITDANQSHWLPLRIADAVLLAYVGGVLVMLFRLGRSMTVQAEIHSLMKQNDASAMEKAFDRLFVAAEQARQRVGLRRVIRVAVAERVAAAVVVGALRPAVLVNASLATGMTPRQLEQILVHEFAHIARHDALVLFTQRLVESLLFFNPAVWYVSRQISELRELCCDQWVVRHFDPIEYADTLVECAEREIGFAQGFRLAATGLSTSGLRQRIGILLQEPARPSSRPRSKSKQKARLTSRVIILLAGITLLFGIVIWERLDSHSLPPQQVEPSWPWELRDAKPEDIVTTTLNSQRLELQDERPDDLVLKAMIDARRCLFAECQFGDANSSPVAIVVEVVSEGLGRVYLDLDRDRTIDPSEQLQSHNEAEAMWLADLDVEVVKEGERIRAKRRIAVTLSHDARNVYVATLGYAQGKLRIGEATFLCRRVDNDGNGIALAPCDDILIDLDGNSEFDVVTERFSPAPWITIADKRYSVRSDSFGQELQLDPIKATGQLELRATLADAKAQIVNMQGILRDRQGFFIAVKLDSTSLELVPGDYCLEQLVTTVRDGKGELWKLSQTQALKDRWITVKADERLELELLSPPKLMAASKLVPGFGGRSVFALETFLVDQHGLVITDFDRLGGEAIGVELQVKRADRVAVLGELESRQREFRCGRITPLTLGDSREVNGSWTVDSVFDSGPFFGEVRNRAEVQVDPER